MIKHSEMVKVLAKSGEAIRTEMTFEGAHILHMAVGIAGEASELLLAVLNGDKPNIVEEAGDSEFYYEGLCQSVGYPGEFPGEFGTDFTPIEQLIIEAGDLLDIAKKLVIYNDFTPSRLNQLTTAMKRYRASLNEIYLVCDFTREDALEANINKLGKRYEGFVYSDKSAKDRNDKKE